ncbi:magnesium-chelatase subunit ChlI chloroplastic-like, partial [Trifolium medium]|nr:magnesium-chelatase subunit ChlI chloroplastic-like [Trifolium medium]
MASTLGTCSIAVFSSRRHSSPSIHSLSLIKGQVFGCKFCGGIGFHGVKGKSQFSVLTVATDINSTEQ